MVSDTAKARYAVLEFLHKHGQATTSELNDAIKAVLGEKFTESKAAGAIRMCVEGESNDVYRTARSVYTYQPAQKIDKSLDPTKNQKTVDILKQKTYIDQVMQEALELAYKHITINLDNSQETSYVLEKIQLLKKGLESNL